VQGAAARLERTGVDALEVLERGRSIARVTRGLIEGALHHGLASARLDDVLPPSLPVARSGLPRTARRLIERRLSAVSVALLRRAGRLAARQGSEAYLVGGVVRDLLLGEAVRDLDLVIVGNTRRLARALAHRQRGRLRWYEAFRTATVHLPDGSQIDLARARREHYGRPAALPRVAPAGLEQDLWRRDFTINALACSLMPDDFGRIVDPCGGREDLRGRRIRLLHGLSVIEDPTRALRALRLRVKLRFRIEQRSSALIHAARRLGIFRRLSSARLRREIERLLSEPSAARAVRAMTTYGLWRELGLPARPQPERYIELRRLERLLARGAPGEGAEGPCVWATVLALLLLGATSERRERLLERLRPSRGITRLLDRAPADARRIARSLAADRAPRPGRVHELCRGRRAEILLLAAALLRSPSRRETVWSYLTTGRRIRADIGGDDLLRAGVARGPDVALGLEAALRAKLDGRASSRKAQLEAALRAVRPT
jgi:tRNA nucleotidyltransferase (CCA-adding enzyme)